MKKYRFLIFRRIIQIGLLFLYILGTYQSFWILKGNLSSSLIFNTIPLSDPFAILQLVFSGAMVGANALIGALIVLLFYGLFARRAFCAYVCPLNLVTDFANFLRRILKIDGLNSSLSLKRSLRYYILALSLILSSIFGLAAFEAISPIGILHRGLIFGFGLGIFGVLVVFLLDLFVVKNGFCGHLCPLGAFYSLIGRFALLKVQYDLEACTNCLECKKICPEKQVLSLVGKRSGIVNAGECIVCGRCIEVCEDNALKFNLINFAKRKNNGL
ncbi:quinol dehydrogenase ferredoxin subunit NapH [Helicobacter valdiviensis]|uniref:Quinol dehydrogenase ferredoxin subunit NapH n=1 Tax=Helicobacter valdiviensis TaxID=1458358 RepID=A0A2W6MXG8_9HELI|nr:quinol dehydrogenase ferredoxin subunit NapH [Helicobacter valdiviensis]PZT49052.1 quinol dehydrogenase ferredoxin subunit NapH [Helicobacter valdiviensis]